MWRPVCALVVVAGCWSDDPLVDGELTTAQLARVREEMRKPSINPCRAFGGTSCSSVQAFAQELFFEPRLSYGHTYSCATCHDSRATGWLIDTRTPNNVSLKPSGTYTKRNVPTLYDLGLKTSFTWTGQYDDAGDVLELAALKAFEYPNGDTWMLAAMVLTDGHYGPEYQQLFGPAPDTDTAFKNLEHAFGAYMLQLQTTSPFDRYIDGDDTALTDSQKRGLGVFVGRGTCIECHRGPALTDDTPHCTGVRQQGEHVGSDDGRFEVTKDPADEGKFVTASLRNVAMTGPYMHDGSIDSLAGVIEFYRRGGDADGYTGTKDPRIQPLDLTDDDARDLEAFLHSLTADHLPPRALLTDPRMPGGGGGGSGSGSGGGPDPCMPGQMLCGAACIDVVTDPMNCGGCGLVCPGPGACMGGMCVPPP